MTLLVGLARFAACSMFCAGGTGFLQASTWTAVRSAHFNIYSQAGPENARATLAWFEELRDFFARDGLLPGDIRLDGRPPVRVIEFQSRAEYAAFRLRKTADAYYVGTGSQDYIVMPALGPGEFSLAAHEYTHLVLHARHWQLPHWLNEGLAEYFSRVRITDKVCEVGGEAPMRAETLRHRAWLPLAALTSLDARSPVLESRDETAIFYAESWGLTDLLVSAPSYAPHFRDLVTALQAGTGTSDAVKAIYGKTLDEVAADLRDWIGQRKSTPMKFLPVESPRPSVQQVALSDDEATAPMADLLLADGELDRAQALYSALAARTPSDPNSFAALGTIALRKGNRVAAEQLWRQAIDKGLKDANLCYEYAVLAGERGADHEQTRRALELAVALRPDFDDARYQLALLESNAGDYEAARLQLRAMQAPSPKRAFGYWSTMAYVLTELDQRELAKQAADEALKNATEPAERSHATQLAYFAETDLTEKFIRDAEGKVKLVTVRVPHGTADFNPFVGPEDQIRHAEGTLSEVRCGDGKMTGLSIQTKDGVLTLAISDPQRVLIRHGPSEFTCGPQPGKSVKVEYAVAQNEDNILKALGFEAADRP